MPRLPKSRSPRSKKTSENVFLQPASLDATKLRQLYSSMIKCRMLVQRVRDLEQDVPHRSALPDSGCEAVVTGMLMDLRAEDRVAPGPPSIPARFILGTPLRAICADLLGNARISSKKDHAAESAVPSSFPAAAQINVILGAAWAFHTRREDNVAVCLCAEDCFSARDWHNAVNFSIQHRLPVIYVVQTGSTDERAGTQSLNREYLGFGDSSLPGLILDGDDALAVYRVGQEAIRRARQGRGPALIECRTGLRACLPGASLSPDDQVFADPIRKLQAYMQHKRLWSERWGRGLVSGFARELDRAIEKAKKSRIQVISADEAADSVLASAG